MTRDLVLCTNAVYAVVRAIRGVSPKEWNVVIEASCGYFVTAADPAARIVRYHETSFQDDSFPGR